MIIEKNQTRKLGANSDARMGENLEMIPNKEENLLSEVTEENKVYVNALDQNIFTARKFEVYK